MSENNNADATGNNRKNKNGGGSGRSSTRKLSIQAMPRPQAQLDLDSVGVSVEGKKVDGARGNADQAVSGSSVLDILAESLRALGSQEGEEVGTEASNVGGGHRGTRDGVLREMKMSAR